MQAAKAFEEGIRKSGHLEVLGQPDMCLVAFKAKRPKQLDIFQLNDLMSKKGWHFSALQLPSALHMCFTAQHVNVIHQLLQVFWLHQFCTSLGILCSQYNICSKCQHELEKLTLAPVTICKVKMAYYRRSAERYKGAVVQQRHHLMLGTFPCSGRRR